MASPDRRNVHSFGRVLNVLMMWIFVRYDGEDDDAILERKTTYQIQNFDLTNAVFTRTSELERMITYANAQMIGSDAMFNAQHGDPQE
jgi:hypothetical protein